MSIEKKMKKFIVPITFACSVLLAYMLYFKKDSSCVSVGICKAIEHEALNSVVSGIEDYLKQQGKKYKISVETSQGNVAIASQIISKFANPDTDIVVAIGTPPSQCGFKLAKKGKIKLVFASVTDPNDISKNLEGSNTTGVSNFVKLEPQIELFKKIQPSLNNLGIIYNFGESNSISIVRRLREVCKNLNVNLIEYGVSSIADIPQVVAKLSADAVFISNDNLALSCISNIVKLCNLKKIPVYVSDTDQVKNGCIAALGPNQYDIGVQTGMIIDRVANGEDINSIAIEYPRTSELYLNDKSAKLLKISFPNDLKSQSKKIYE